MCEVLIVVNNGASWCSVMALGMMMINVGMSVRVLDKFVLLLLRKHRLGRPLLSVIGCGERDCDVVFCCVNVNCIVSWTGLDGNHMTFE